MSSEDEEEDPKADILLMEQGILESKKNYNNIPVLLQMVEGAGEEESEASLLAAIALCRVFVRLMAQGALVPRRGTEKDAVVVGWLKDQLSAYKAMLLRLLGTEDFSGTALTLCMRVLQAEGEYMYEKEEYTFPTMLHQSITTALLEAEDDGVRQAYMEEYAEKYDDIRYYTFKSIK